MTSKSLSKQFWVDPNDYPPRLKQELSGQFPKDEHRYIWGSLDKVANYVDQHTNPDVYYFFQASTIRSWLGRGEGYLAPGVDAFFVKPNRWIFKIDTLMQIANTPRAERRKEFGAYEHPAWSSIYKPGGLLPGGEYMTKKERAKRIKHATKHVDRAKKYGLPIDPAQLEWSEQDIPEPSYKERMEFLRDNGSDPGDWRVLSHNQVSILTSRKLHLIYKLARGGIFPSTVMQVKWNEDTVQTERWYNINALINFMKHWDESDNEYRLEWEKETGKRSRPKTKQKEVVEIDKLFEPNYPLDDDFINQHLWIDAQIKKLRESGELPTPKYDAEEEWSAIGGPEYLEKVLGPREAKKYDLSKAFPGWSPERIEEYRQKFTEDQQEALIDQQYEAMRQLIES